MESSRSLTITVLRQTTNGRGEVLLSPVSIAKQEDLNSTRLVPLFANEGGTKSELILINSTEKTLRGNITFYDNKSRKYNFGTASDYMSYYLPPYSSQIISSDGTSPRSTQGFVLLEPIDEESASYAVALVKRSYGDIWGSESLIVGLHAKEMSYTIDQRLNPVRHGEIDARLVVVNQNTETVNVRVLLGAEEIISKLIKG